MRGGLAAIAFSQSLARTGVGVGVGVLSAFAPLVNHAEDHINTVVSSKKNKFESRESSSSIIHSLGSQRQGRHEGQWILADGVRERNKKECVSSGRPCEGYMCKREFASEKQCVLCVRGSVACVSGCQCSEVPEDL